MGKVEKKTEIDYFHLMINQMCDTSVEIEPTLNGLEQGHTATYPLNPI